MRKRTILTVFSAAVFAILLASPFAAYADDLTTIDPASRAPGDSASNYSDAAKTPAAPTVEPEQAKPESSEQNPESGITPDIATGEDDY